MRKVVAGLFISVDGVTESPDKWQFEYFDDDMMAAMGSHIAAEDTILFMQDSDLLPGYNTNVLTKIR